jgi:hypothetical protein
MIASRSHCPIILGVLLTILGCSTRPVANSKVEDEKATPKPIEALPDLSSMLRPVDSVSTSQHPTQATSVGDATRSAENVSSVPSNPIEALLFQDSFSNVSGCRHQIENGKSLVVGSPRTRSLSIYSASATSDYLLSMSEDNIAVGADGEPGVLSISWDKIPETFDYCGFRYGGYRLKGPPLELRPVALAKVPSDLAGFRVRCKYRGFNNKESATVKFSFDFRLEVMGNEAYEKRADLGRYVASNEWKNIDTDLGDVKNCDLFLKAIADHRPDGFKLVWSQVGNGSDNQAGETLLIDDIEFQLPAGKKRSDFEPAMENESSVPIVRKDDAGMASPLDLTRQYSMKASEFQSSNGYPWPGVPQGSQVFAKVPLEIGGAFFLWGARNAGMGMDYPKQIDIADVPKRFQSLYLCHSLFFEGQQDSPVCEIQIRYADGTTTSDTIRCGADALDWFVKSDDVKSSPSSDRSMLAWQGESPWRNGMQPIRYCLTRVDNPSPTQDVESIRLVSSEGDAAICILAITAGKADLMK